MSRSPSLWCLLGETQQILWQVAEPTACMAPETNFNWKLKIFQILFSLLEGGALSITTKPRTRAECKTVFAGLELLVPINKISRSAK